MTGESKSFIALMMLAAVLLLHSFFLYEPVTVPDDVSAKTDFAAQAIVSAADRVESAAEPEPMQMQLPERVRLRYTPLVPVAVVIAAFVVLCVSKNVFVENLIISFCRKLYLICFPLRAGPGCR